MKGHFSTAAVYSFFKKSFSLYFYFIFLLFLSAAVTSGVVKFYPICSQHSAVQKSSSMVSNNGFNRVWIVLGQTAGMLIFSAYCKPQYLAQLVLDFITIDIFSLIMVCPGVSRSSPCSVSAALSRQQPQAGDGHCSHPLPGPLWLQAGGGDPGIP